MNSTLHNFAQLICVLLYFLWRCHSFTVFDGWVTNVSINHVSSKRSCQLNANSIRTLLRPSVLCANQNEFEGDVGVKVKDMLAKAKAIRDSLPSDDNLKPKDTDTYRLTTRTPSVGYRVYFDIGREDGTWMDPSWGRSGRRIEGSVDIFFQVPPDSSSNQGNIDSSLADQEIISKMVKDNLSGKSTAVRVLESNPNARLRGGFDKMESRGGGYRIDVAKNSATARFYLEVDGTEDGSYGDINIPPGCLYFSLPCFYQSINHLSSKQGIISVQQIGWHTGWRRLESRIVGVFKAVPLEQALKKDRF